MALKKIDIIFLNYDDDLINNEKDFGMGKLYGFFIAKFRDDKILYSYGTDEKTTIEFQKILDSPAWKNVTTDKLILTMDNNDILNITIDEDLVYALHTTNSYSSLNSKMFLDELMAYVKPLYRKDINSIKNNKWYSDLIAKYSVDKIEVVKSQVNDLKNIMISNINVAIGNGEKINDLLIVTENLKNNSYKFSEQSKKLATVMKCRNWKITAMITAVVLIVLAIIIAVILA